MTDMMTVTTLGDGSSLRLEDGPLSLVIGVDASPGAVAAAQKAAIERFRTMADEIAAEMDVLRAPAERGRTALTGPVARRAWRAVRPFAEGDAVTPLAAIKGAAAEEVLAAAMEAAKLDRVFVNCRGHVALHLTAGYGFRAGLADGPDFELLFGGVELRVGDPVRGIGVSGRAGGSPSLGIADAVTVLAQTAAKADAAATLIANAVDLPGHPAVTRVPAAALAAGHFLGERAVVTGLGDIEPGQADQALAAGKAVADDLVARGLIASACLRLRRRMALAGPLAPVALSDAATEPLRASGR